MSSRARELRVSSRAREQHTSSCAWSSTRPRVPYYLQSSSHNSPWNGHSSACAAKPARTGFCST